MEKGRSPAETALKPLRNPGAEQRQHEAGIEDSISEWMDTNFPQENYVPPVLSEDEFRKLEPAPRNSICPASSGESLPSRRLQLILTDREEDMLIRLRRSFVRYGDDDWVPSDEDILHELLALLAQCEPIKARILGSADLRDALALILRNRTENEQS